MSAAPAPVAQLDRAADYESEGRTFESFRARQIPPITAETTPAHTAVFRGGKVRIGSGRLVNFDPAQTWDLGICWGRTAMGWERTVWFWFRSEERRVGKALVSPCRSRVWTERIKKKKFEQ